MNELNTPGFVEFCFKLISLKSYVSMYSYRMMAGQKAVTLNIWMFFLAANTQPHSRYVHICLGLHLMHMHQGMLYWILILLFEKMSQMRM